MVEHAADAARPECGLEAPEPRIVQYLEGNAEALLAADRGQCGAVPGLAGVDVEIAARPEMRGLEPELVEPALPGGERAAVQRNDRLGGGFDTRWRGGGDEPRHPGKDLRQVGEADRHRSHGIEQPAGQIAPDLGTRQRRDVGVRDHAGIAARGAFGDAIGIDERHLMALVHQRVRRVHANDACPDHQTMHATTLTYVAPTA